MTKLEFLKYVRNRLNWMGSNASPSFQDSQINYILDQAYLLVIANIVKSENLEYLTKLTANLVLSGSKDGRVLSVDNSMDDYLYFINGSVKTSRNGESELELPIEVVSIKHYTIFTDVTNKMYYAKPKIFFSTLSSTQTASSALVVTDSYSRINSPLNLSYVIIPKKFEDMKDDEVPLISEAAHLNIVTKAAELISNTLNPASAGNEIVNNDRIAQ